MIIKSKFFFLAIILSGIFILVKDSQAETIPVIDLIGQPSCEQVDVQEAINKARNGDTVSVPTRECVWSSSSSVVINKEITLKGQGVGKTIIKEAHINLPNGLDNWRISGFSFIGTSGIGIVLGQYTNIALAENWRIDNNLFEGYTNWIQLDCRNKGVIDNNEFYNPSSTGIYVWADNSESWNRPVLYGSDDFTFVEDNLFSTNISGSGHWILIGRGGRGVIRYNIIQEISPGYWEGGIDVHGKCHGSGAQSGRAWIIYNNNFSRSGRSTCCRGMNIRGGTGLVFNNYFDKSAGGYIQGGQSADIQLQEYRLYPNDEKFYGISDDCGDYPVPGVINVCQSFKGGEGYPCYEQVGTGLYGIESEPAYFWNNLDQNGDPVDIYIESKDIDYIQEGRDYFLSPKPGYVPYTYPHPLRNENPTDLIPPSHPTGLSVR